MKKICIITQCVLPVPAVKGGAVETLVEYFINENEKKGTYDITVVGIKNADAERIAKNYKYTKFFYVKSHNKILNDIRYFCYRVLKKVGIYISTTFEYIDVINYLKKESDKFDYVLYEAGPTTQIELLAKVVPKNKLLVHLHWDGMGSKRVDKYFDYLLPVSKYIGEQWKSATGRSNEKIKVWANCVDIAKFKKRLDDESKVSMRSSLGIEKKDKVLLYIGRIVEEKGVLELLCAFQKLKTSNIKLLLVGSANFGQKTMTKYEKDVYSKVKEIGTKVIQVGYVHQNELYKYYEISDIAIMPSQFQEPAGLVALETMTTGTPLIASNVGGLPEYVEKECTKLVDKTANYCDELANAIDMMFEENIVNENNRQKAILFAEKYSTEKYFIDFEQFVERINMEK